MSQISHNITQLLRQSSEGDSQAQQVLFQMVYTELRRLAHQKMRANAPDCLLQPTVLVHEAYLKLFGSKAEWPAFENRRHLFAVFARAVQEVLVDYARRRLAKKRQPPPSCPLSPTGDVEKRCYHVLQVDAHLDRLAAESPQAAELVRMRFFGGYTMAETAQALNISVRTAQRLWSLAKARLYQWIRDAQPPKGR